MWNDVYEYEWPPNETLTEVTQQSEQEDHRPNTSIRNVPTAYTTVETDLRPKTWHSCVRVGHEIESYPGYSMHYHSNNLLTYIDEFTCISIIFMYLVDVNVFFRYTQVFALSLLQNTRIFQVPIARHNSTATE